MDFIFHLDLQVIIRAIGYIGVTAIVFAESGLLIGFFLPGDSLLVTAGLLAAQGYFSFPLLVTLVFFAAVAGDAVGYTFGRRVGRKVFNKEGSLFFDPMHLERAEAFYERYGGKAIILARWMPVLRTFAPILAGVAKMLYPRFAFFNIIGALLWGVGMTSLGFIIGNTIPGVEKYMLLIVTAVVVISFLPAVWHILKDKEERARLIRLVKKGFMGLR